MAQDLTQELQQEQRQVQRLTQQQILQVRLLQMPLAELEQSVKEELDDNPALETTSTDDALSAQHDDSGDAAGESFEEQSEREERKDALDSALEGIGRDDEMPAASYGWGENQGADYEEMVYGDTTSFYDKLKEQILETELNDEQREVMEYLIGSLDSDGYLRKDLSQICDELAINNNLDLPEQSIADVLAILQGFDPPGIGARSLKECLLLQVERKPKGWVRSQLKRLFTDHFEAFTKRHWNRIKDALQLTDDEVDELQHEIRRLNPKPGAALGETMGRSLQQITPDFIVDTTDDGTVTFTLNRGQVPELVLSPAFTDMLDAYRQNPKGMSRSEKEALLYTRKNVERAQGYIEAIRQRHHTLRITMQAIIDWQRRFFQDGDEADLRPMVLKDIAERTGLDISTISRVSKLKYAQTRWGTFPLRFFFNDSYTTGEGEELSTRRIKMALREIIDAEDKRHPLSDEKLTAELAQRGFPVARRTVAKYREQLGVPVARLRHE